VQKVSRVRYAIYVQMVLVVVWAVVFWFLHIFKCGVHIGQFWGSYQALENSCINVVEMQFGFNLTDLITDILILLLPLPMVSDRGVSNLSSINY
jgi:hypothetical protein